MIYSLFNSAWGAVAAQMRQETVANNMANVNTPGFKPDWLVTRSFKNREEGLGLPADPDRRVLWTTGGGGMITESRTSLLSGPQQKTGKGTDLAITGNKGFFAVEKDGQHRYTRAGNFLVNSNGELVTADGDWRVLDSGGDGPIQVGGPDFMVSADGTISRRTPDGPEEVGRVRLVEFENPQLLNKTEGTMFAAPEGLEPVEAGAEVSVRQYWLEGSAANPAQTMIEMIEALRAYEANMNLVRMQDGLLGRAANEIARLGG